MTPKQQDRNERALSAGQSGERLSEHAVRGGTIAFGGQIARLIVQMAGTVILARLLTPADFGLIAMAATVTAFIGMFTDMGLSTATIQRSVVSQQLVSTLFFINLAAGFMLMIIAVIAAPVAAWIFDDPRVLVLVICLAAAIPISAAAAQHNALLVRAMRWIPIQIIAVVGQLAGLATGVLMAWWAEAGYWAIIGQTLVAASTSFALSWYFCAWRPSWMLNWHNARAEIGFGAHLSGFNFLNYFHRQFDNVLIGWRWGAVELGYYSRAYNLLTLPIGMVNGAMSQIAVPLLSKLKESPEEWNRAYLQMSTITAYAGIGICTILLVSGRPLISILLGDQWGAVADIFAYLSISSILATGGNSCGWVFVSLGKSREYFRWALFASPLFVLSFAIGLPWKASGVALSYAIAMAINVPLYYTYALMQTTLSWKRLLAWIGPVYGLSLAAAAAGLAARPLVNSLPPVAQIVIGSLIVTVIYLGGGFICLTRMSHYATLKTIVFAAVARARQSFGKWGVAG
ncbi:MAG: lipopolysaccharide biosynthesis protein [Sphingomonadaceae bacterium]